MTDEELLEILEHRIPDLLDRHPELKWRVYSAFLDVFARREEVAAIMNELRELRTEFHQFRDETRERFEQIDQRFESLTHEMRQGFEQINQRQAQMHQELEDLKNWKDWMELVVGRLQTRTGRRLEDVVAGALRYALKRPDIRPESIRLRQKIVDTEGYVFPKGKQKEVDILADNDEYLVFEVKSVVEPEDVDDFADKVALMRKLYPDKNVRGIIVTLAYEPDVEERCRELGIDIFGRLLTD